jgi:hypothetical protein
LDRLISVFIFSEAAQIMNKPPMIFVLFVLVIAIFATCQYFQQRRTNAENNAAPPRSVSVEITAKREYLSPNRRSRQRENIPVEDKKYEGYFKPLKGGSEIKLQLDETTYNALAKGQKGVLTVKGTRFVTFTAQDAP